MQALNYLLKTLLKYFYAVTNEVLEWLHRGCFLELNGAQLPLSNTYLHWSQPIDCD